MTTAADFVAMGAPVRETVGHAPDPEMLSKLICTASAALESDQATAKACIQRAVELLRVRRSAEGLASPTAFRRGLAPWQQKRVAAHVAANLGSRIRSDELARVARLSLGHFFRAFRESFGEPPLAYVARQRIERARSLMLGSRARLSEIALECGMCDQAHFTRVFRRIIGVSPGIWRRHFSNGETGTNDASIGESARNT